MDALTWFKAVFHRAPAPLRAEPSPDHGAVVPLHVAAARLRPPAAPASDEDDWGVLIARAKLQASSPKAPFPPPLPPPRLPSLRAPYPPPIPGPRHALPETVVTPPPSPARQPPRVKGNARAAAASERASATLDAFIQRRSKTPAASR